MRCTRVALVLGLLSACDSATQPERLYQEVYEFRLDMNPLSVLRWPTGSTVRVYVHPATDTIHAKNINAAVRHGIRAWNDVARFGEYTLELARNIENADAVVVASETELPVVVSDCLPSGGRAYTTFCLAEGNERLRPFPLANEADVQSNVRFLVTIRSSEASSAAAARTLITHELGHVLGIARHSPRAEDLMSSSSNLLRDVPNTRDRITMQALYKARADVIP